MPLSMHPLEQPHRDDGVDDVAVLRGLADPDRLTHVGETDVAGAEGDHLVRHAEVGGEATRIREVLAALGADRERDAVGVHLAHVDEGERAVQPAGEHHADGQVGVDPHPHRLAVGAAHEVGGLVEVLDHRQALAELQEVDVGVQHRLLARLGPAAVTRRDLVDGDARPDPAHERLDLGGDGQETARARPVERLHPGRVAREEHPSRMPVDETEGELAPEAQQGVLTPGEDALEHDLGVAVRPQVVPLVHQPTAQRGEVEHLAVVGQRPPFVGRAPGLHGVVAVDDAQPVGAEQGVVVGERLLDLASRSNRREHGRERRVLGARTRTDQKGNAAHRLGHSLTA